jgi:hypothetical protein
VPVLLADKSGRIASASLGAEGVKRGPGFFLAGIFLGEGLPCSPIGGIALMLWIVANGGVLCLLWLNPLSHLAAGGVANTP